MKKKDSQGDYLIGKTKVREGAVMSRRQRYSGKSQSIIAAKLAEPERQLAGYIPRIKREVAWLMHAPLENIYDIRLMKHQFWVSYRGADGKTCSTFFSYRRLPLWQELIVSKIYTCPNRQELAKFSAAMRWEYRNFCYPTAMRDAIDEALENRYDELLVAASIEEQACQL